MDFALLLHFVRRARHSPIVLCSLPLLSHNSNAAEICAKEYITNRHNKRCEQNSDIVVLLPVQFGQACWRDTRPSHNGIGNRDTVTKLREAKGNRSRGFSIYKATRKFHRFLTSIPRFRHLAGYCAPPTILVPIPLYALAL